MLVVINAAIQIISIPILLHVLGAQEYGIFTLISTIGLFGYFINIGFNLSVLKFVGEQGPGIESDRDIIIPFIGITVLTLIASGIILVFNKEVLIQILGLPSESIDSGTLLLLNSIVFTNGLLFIGQVLTAVLDAMKKIYVTNSLQMIYIIVNRLALIYVLLSGGRFDMIALVYFITSLLWFVSLCIVFFRHWSFTQISGFTNGSIERIQKHLRYGIKIYLTSITGFFYEPFIKVLISRYIGITEVGYFDVAFKIKTLFWGVMEKGLYPMLPKIVSGTEESNRTQIHWLSRKLLLISIPFVACLYFILDPLIRLWLGGEPIEIIFSVQVLIVVHIMTASGIPMYMFLITKDHPEKTFIIQLLNALLSMVYFFTLVPFFGYYGSIFAFVGAVLTSQLLLMRWQKKILGSNILEGSMDYAKTLSIALMIAIVNLIIITFEPSILLSIFMIGIVDLVLMIVLLLGTAIITMDDVRFVVGKQSFR